jgi:DNA-binding MarR family transcriptional regulator
VTNVSRPSGRVKGGERPSPAATPSGREALEISKLLVEVLLVGHVGRRPGGETTAHANTADGGGFHATGSADGTGAHQGLPEPIASHVIRAAIYVHTNGPQTIGQLAAGLGISQGWASRIVDEMERAGYLERQRDPQDRRVVRVSLVPAAVERVELAYRWRGDAVEAALQGMSAEERSAVEQFLRRFVDAARVDG